MSELTLTFLGSGNAFAPGGLCWNGFVANRRYLFEAPPQALMALNTLNLDPNELDAVILSHHHGDHFLGLPFLLLHWKHMGRTRPVTIVGPPHTAAVTRTVCDAVYPGLFEEKYGIEWVEAAPGVPLAIGDLELESVLVKHDPRLNQSLGFHCLLDGRRLGYTGDSAMCEGVLELAQRNDVLVSECASRASRIPIHMNLVDDMPALRSAMPASASLVITHVSADVGSTDLPNTLIARDLQTYQF